MTTNYPWRTGRHCLSKSYYHLVFVTKYRHQVFTAAMLKRLQIIFAGTCEQMESELLEFNGEHDHVHLMLTLPPKLALANLIGKLKGKSAFFLRKE